MFYESINVLISFPKLQLLTNIIRILNPVLNELGFVLDTNINMKNGTVDYEAHLLFISLAPLPQRPQGGLQFGIFMQNSIFYTANVYISATSLLQLQRCSLHLVVVYDYQMYFTTSTLHPSVVINTFTSLLQPKRCSLKVSTSMLRLKRCTLTMQTLILQMVEYFSQCSAQLARCT